MLNTLFVACTVTALKLFLDSMAGYALAKLEFTGKRVVFVLMLILLMVPFAALLIPLWSIAHNGCTSRTPTWRSSCRRWPTRWASS